MKLVLDISEGDYDWIRRWAKDGTQVPVYDTLARYIANGKVLSEEQEHKTGKWISQWFKGIQFYVCSECREEFSYDNETGVSMDSYDYCPNCGAKMEVDE